MLFDLISESISAFLKYRKNKIEDESDMLYIRRRQLLHKGIPDLEVIKKITGSKFFELQKIINHFDPINTQKLKDNPDKYLFLLKL